MDASKQFIKDSGFTPRISFKDNPVHTVVLLKDKLETITVDGEDKTGVKYLVQEDGINKSFFTSSVTLVQKLSDYQAGDEVKIEQKSFKSGGTFKTTYEVELVKKAALKIKEDQDVVNAIVEGDNEMDELIEEIPF